MELTIRLLGHSGCEGLAHLIPVGVRFLILLLAVVVLLQVRPDFAYPL